MPSIDIRLVAFIGLTLSSILFASIGVAQDTVGENDPAIQLQERLAIACKERNLPAIWAGKYWIDRPALVGVAGIRKWKSSEEDQADVEPARVDDIVHLGSCTKAMTAVVIGQLCTEGKLRLDSKLQEVFTDVEGLNESSWGTVTINELLRHRSGAMANLNWHQFDKTHPSSIVDARRMMLEQLIKTRRPKSPKFVYSNVGYATLGHIAETVEGKSWEEIVAERVFKPLDMKTAHFGPVGNPDGSKVEDSILKDRAWGHTEVVDVMSVAKSLFGGSQKNIAFEPLQIDNSPSLGPAGRAHMNLEDWSKFVIPFARKDGYQAFGISSDVWQQMLTPQESSSANESYAAGWIIFDKPAYGGTAYFHNGSNTTWYCYAIAAPEKGYVILVATNVFSNPARQACDEVAKYLEPIE